MSFPPSLYGQTLFIGQFQKKKLVSYILFCSLCVYDGSSSKVYLLCMVKSGSSQVHFERNYLFSCFICYYIFIFSLKLLSIEISIINLLQYTPQWCIYDFSNQQDLKQFNSLIWFIPLILHSVLLFYHILLLNICIIIALNSSYSLIFILILILFCAHFF